MLRRGAKFNIQDELLQCYPASVKELLDEVLVFDAYHCNYSGYMKYLGVSRHFPQRPDGEPVPYLNIITDYTEDGDVVLSFDLTSNNK